MQVACCSCAFQVGRNDFLRHHISVFLINCLLLSEYVTLTKTVLEEGTTSYEVIPLDTPNCKLLSDVQ